MTDTWKKIMLLTALICLLKDELRTYRTVIACTGEYAAYFGGTQAAALAAIVVSLNRVNGVYEKEASVRMVLVANNIGGIYKFFY
jgi:hypothetical protein